jgi:hypothetical protein
MLISKCFKDREMTSLFITIIICSIGMASEEAGEYLMVKKADIHLFGKNAITLIPDLI